MCSERIIAAWHRQQSTRRGGILFEVILALVLFAGAASFTLAAARSVLNSLDQQRRREEAIDLARSRLAELQAGLITLADLRGERSDAVGSTRTDQGNRKVEPTDSRGWILDAKTRRTSWTGLSLIELTVREDLPAEAHGLEPVSFTLRQLISLGGRQAGFEEIQDDE